MGRNRCRFVECVFLCVFVLLSARCTNIDNFDNPHLVESFLGALAVTPSVDGLYASGRATGGVTVVGGSEGNLVTIYGLPTNEPFKLIPDSPLTVIPPTVSGLDAEVVEPNLLRIFDFSSKGGAAVDWDMEVRGMMVREGPRLSTHPEHPIVISVRASDLKNEIKDAFPDRLRQRIRRENQSIDEIPDSEMIDLYQINFRGEATTVL